MEKSNCSLPKRKDRVYGSVCSGIEAATVAWKPLGWEAAWFSEIAPFQCELLEHYYPGVPNLGDMEHITEREEFKRGRIWLLVGGTPCQAFSVAGLRKGLDDPRGNLALVFLQVVDRARPTWVVWENVPGVHSVDEGRAFAAFIGGLAQLGYGVCYRVLDAQYFGLAQRRERVFAVGYLGDWRPSAAVLFEQASMSGNPPPRRKAGEAPASTVTASSMRSGGATAGNNPGLVNPILTGVAGTISHGHGRGFRNDLDTSGAFIPLTEGVSKCLTSRNARNDAETETLIAHCLTARHDGSPDGSPDGSRGYPIVAIAENQRGELRTSDVSPSLGGLGGLGGKVGQGYQAVQSNLGVRRLTPLEWERLQGFPDNYTRIRRRDGKLAADSPRYESIGNSMPVPIMRWIGERIQKVSEILEEAK